MHIHSLFNVRQQIRTFCQLLWTSEKKADKVFFLELKRDSSREAGAMPCTSDEWPSKGETRRKQSAVGSVSSASEGGRPFENGAESFAAVVVKLSLKHSVVTPALERKEASGSVRSRRLIVCLSVEGGCCRYNQEGRELPTVSVRACVCVCRWRGWRRGAVLSVLSHTEKIKSPNGPGFL